MKAYTQHTRGAVEAVKVLPTTTIPPNWKTFLRNDKNKTALYEYLSQCVESYTFMAGKTVVSTHGDNVLKSNTETDFDVTDLQPCNHEEADYRMLLHAAHDFNTGCKRVLIQATDTD